MRESALNNKLRAFYWQIGLLKRNTYYSLRWTAIIETRREGGDSLAKNLAFHVEGGNTILTYDNMGLASTDIIAFRLGETRGKSKKDVAAMFCQANNDRHVSSSPESSLPRILDERISEKLGQDAEYMAVENQLATLYNRISTELVAC